MDLRRHPYADFVHRVEKPARYLGGEYLSTTKDPATVRTALCLAFPDLYDIGMSHLGTRILYSLVNKDPSLACERAFAPWPDMARELRSRKLPLVSLESARPLSEFDVLGFSLQFELTYTNVLDMLDLAGLPIRSADRDERHPLVVAGGPTATHPEPLSPFVDAFLVGDAEEILPRTLHLLADWRAEGLPRREVLRRLSALGGWYCPALYPVKRDPRSQLLVVDPDRAEGPYPVVRAFVPDIDRYPFPTDAPVAAAEAIFDRVSIEIARGCTEGCRFCQAGMIYRPVRERDPEQIAETVVAALEKGGYDQVSLTSLSTADYSCVSPLIKKVMGKLRERRASLSVSSLRAYGLAEDLLDEISSVKATGLTFAPEAGTQRLRDVVNKNISDQDIETTADRVFSRGWSRMKFYFMIGLPTETDLDVEGIVETAARSRQIGFRHLPRHKVEVTASASSHVPKPHTPFQWAAMDPIDEIVRKQRILKDLGRMRRITVKVHDPRGSYIEGILSRGDRDVAGVVEAAWRKGATFDGWDEHLRFDAWLEALDESGLDPQRYLGTLPVDGGLPWDHIDVGLAPRFLEKEWKRALKDKLSPPCGKPLGMQVHATNLADADADDRKLVCYHCGVACDLGQMRDERKAFLKKLGAFTPPGPRSEEDPPPAWTTVRKNRFGTPLPPKREDQGEGFRYRVRFTKLGPAAMTSQLDLARSIPRIVRRAGVPLKYSEGFSPKPILAYGPALPLGVRSLAEVFDMVALADLPPDALVRALEAVTDGGVRILGAARLAKEDGAAPRIAKLAEYFVAVPGRVAWSDLEAAAARARSGLPLPIAVRRKKGERAVDALQGVQDLRVDSLGPAEAALLEVPAGTPGLRWRVDLDAGAGVRPNELFAALHGSEPEGLLAVRTALFGWRKGVLFDLLVPEGDYSSKNSSTVSCQASPAS